MNKDADRILTAPNSIGAKPIRPFLINMNELPQINERVNKRPQAFNGIFWVIKNND
tara:strand:+ start:743 stop:910 length:168 start_codon:yes stop_codon:yes gene_type:complete